MVNTVNYLNFNEVKMKLLLKSGIFLTAIMLLTNLNATTVEEACQGKAINDKCSSTAFPEGVCYESDCYKEDENCSTDNCPNIKTKCLKCIPEEQAKRLAELSEGSTNSTGSSQSSGSDDGGCNLDQSANSMEIPAFLLMLALISILTLKRRAKEAKSLR